MVDGQTAKNEATFDPKDRKSAAFCVAGRARRTGHDSRRSRRVIPMAASHNWLRRRDRWPHAVVAVGLFALTGRWLVRADWDVGWVAFGGLGYVVLLAWATTVPALVIAISLHHKDKFLQQSWRRLGLLALAAALAACLAGLSNDFVERGVTEHNRGYTWAHSVFLWFFGVGFVEEAIKAGVVWLLAWRRGWFRQVYDGVLFCAASALGFATIENLHYVFTAGDLTFGVALTRAIFAVPGHVIDSIAMGYFMGRAWAARGTDQEFRHLTTGFVLAVSLHGTYNLLVTQRTLLFFPFFAASLYVAIRLLRQALTHSPLVRCSRCAKPIPRRASFCPHCRKGRLVYLACECGNRVRLGETRCGACNKTLRVPWHLRSGLLPRLYTSLRDCPRCGSRTPHLSYCFACGVELRIRGVS